MSRVAGRFNRGSLPLRILDTLEADGGWLTPAGLAHIFDAKEESVRQALKRLRDRGLVESRIVELAGTIRTDAQSRVGNSVGVLDSRQEWRFLTWGGWG